MASRNADPKRMLSELLGSDLPVTHLGAYLQLRQVVALERIADALEAVQTTDDNGATSLRIDGLQVLVDRILGCTSVPDKHGHGKLLVEVVNG